MSEARSTELRVVIAGIGGQGVIFATRLLTQAAIHLGLPAIAAESHGMSQRGGSVVSHLRIGGLQSPLIRRGTADLILGLDETEALRNLVYLRAGGSAVVNSEQALNPEIDLRLRSREIAAYCLPASQLAIDLGAVTIANVVLTGFAVGLGLFPFTEQDLRETLQEAVPRGRELNFQALRRGLELAQAELAAPGN